MKNKADVLSCLAVRRAIGLIGFFLPVSLYVYAWGFGYGMQPSMSEFYHTHMGDVFVGCLVAIGVFLISYRGYPRQPDELVSDRWVSAIAGCAAILVALLPARPQDLDSCPPGQSFLLEAKREIMCPIQGIYQHWITLEWLHFTAAAVFFVCLSVFSLHLFPKGNLKKDGRVDWSVRENCIYLLSGIILITTILAVLGYSVSGSETKAMLRSYNYVFWWEVAGVIAFSIAWLTKGKITKAVYNFGTKAQPKT